jgi:hypothetical protein
MQTLGPCRQSPQSLENPQRTLIAPNKNACPYASNF